MLSGRQFAIGGSLKSAIQGSWMKTNRMMSGPLANTGGASDCSNLTAPHRLNGGGFVRIELGDILSADRGASMKMTSDNKSLELSP
jgi:hypothetical protein